MPKPKQWYVYMVACRDDTLYAGITTDLQRRMGEHNGSEKGAKYTRARRPVVLVYERACKNRSEASKAEYQIKKLSRDEKMRLIEARRGEEPAGI